MKTVLGSFFAAMILFLLIGGDVTALADTTGFNPVNIQAVSDATGGEGNLVTLIQTLINYILGFLGIVSVAIFIWGGMQYVTAGVNEGGQDAAKKSMTYAVIGIVVILLSFVIVNALLAAGGGDSPVDIQ